MTDKSRKFVLTFFLVLALVSTASATTLFFDDFEDQSLSEYSGGTSAFSFQTDNVWNGSYSIKDTSSGSSDLIYLSDTYSQKVNQSVYVYADSADGSSTYSSLAWVQDSSNYYRIRWDPGGNEFDIREATSGGNTYLNETTVSTNFDEWYRIVYQKDGSSYKAWIFDASNGTKLGEVSATDSSLNADKAGIWSYNPTYFDDFSVYNGSSTAKTPSLSNPNPSDGAIGVSTSTSLNLDYSDPQGDSGTVTFYWQNGTQIQQFTGVSSGSTVSTSSLSLSGDTTYSWYATASDGSNTASAGNYSFTTETTSLTVVDDFEDGDISEYSGDTGSYSITSNHAYNGGNSLKGVSSGTGRTISSITGLNAYPSEGDVFNCFFKVDTGVTIDGYQNTGCKFGYQDSNNHYYAGVDQSFDRLRTGKKDGGTYSQNTKTGLSLSKGTWYRLRINWTSSSNEVDLIDTSTGNIVNSVSFSDSTWSGGGVAFSTYDKSGTITAYHDYMFIEGSASGGSGTISVSTPEQYQVFQRETQNHDFWSNVATGNGLINISGSYSGTPDWIEARFNGGNWQNITTNPSGGSFDGSIVGSEGQGSLEVRFGNSTSVNASVSEVGVGDVWVLAGQSNMVGKGNQQYTQSHPSLTATAYDVNDQNWEVANDPIHSSREGTGYGSMIPILFSDLMDNTSVPQAGIAVAEPGSNIFQWQKGASAGLYSRMVTHVGEATEETDNVRGVLWYQGEDDSATNSGAESKDEYKTNLNWIINNSTNEIGTDDWFIGQVGRNHDAGQVDLIREAQQETWLQRSRACRGAVTYNITTSDGVHFQSDAEIQEFEDRWFNALQIDCNTGYGNLANSGFYFEDAYTSDNRSIVVSVTQAIDQSVVPEKDIFEVTDGAGTNYTIGSVGFKNSTSFWVNLSSQHNTNLQVNLGSGNAEVTGLTAPLSTNGLIGNTFYNRPVSVKDQSDTTPPTSSDNYTASGFVDKSSVEVEITATDDDSGVSNISYRVNGGSYATDNGNTTTVTISEQGNNTLEYYATDNAGNQESVNTEYVALDASVPVTIHNPENQTYGTSSVDLSVSSSESVSTWEYSLDGGTNQSFTPNTSITGVSDGRHSLTVYGMDSDGNTGSSSVGFTVDTSPPTTAFTSSSTGSGEQDQDNIYVNVSATDQLSGVSSVVERFTSDNRSLSEYSDGYYVFNHTGLSDGSYTVEIWAEDSVGNTEYVSRDITLNTSSSDSGGGSEDPVETYVVQDLPRDRAVGLRSDLSQDLTSDGVSGVNTAVFGENRHSLLATELEIDFSGNVSVADLSYGVNRSEARSFVHNQSSVTGLQSTNLLVPRVNGTGQVLVCPGADSLSAVSPGCGNGFNVSTGETVDGVSISEISTSGFDYYRVDGITGTGAVEVESSGSDGTGSGSVGGSLPEEEDDTGSSVDYNWSVSLSSDGNQSSLKTFLEPGSSTDDTVYLENTGSESVELSIGCGSNSLYEEDVCNWLNLSTSTVTLDSGESRQVGFTVELPLNASRTDYLFELQVTDPSHSEDSEQGVKSVDYSVSSSPLYGLVSKLTEVRQVESPTGEGRPVPVPVALIPLLLGVAAFSGLTLADSRSRVDISSVLRFGVSAFLVVVVFVLI